MKPAISKDASRYCAKKYDSFYDNPQASRENGEIKRLFRAAFPHEGSWLDIGCGTGFGFTLIHNKKGYLGLDINLDMVLHCKQKHSQGSFINENAETQDFHRNILSIFSLNYLSLKAAERLIRESVKAFVVIYNKPYLDGSASAYKGKACEYLARHCCSSRHIRSLLKANGFKVSKLLNEPYYYVGVKNGRSAEARIDTRISNDAGNAAGSN